MSHNLLYGNWQRQCEKDQFISTVQVEFSEIIFIIRIFSKSILGNCEDLRVVFTKPQLSPPDRAIY